MRLWWKATLCRDHGPYGEGPSSVFIRGGELEKVMGHFHDG